MTPDFYSKGSLFFKPMPTVFERITAICSESNFTPLTHGQRADLGRKINREYKSFVDQKNLPKKPELIRSVEPDGVFKVFNYPPEFIPIIDSFILLKINPPPQPKQRKRIATKPVKEISVKPSNIQ